MSLPRWTSYVPLSQVRPAFRNAQRHDTARLRKSIDRHGFADQPIVDERTGRLVAGHGRIEDLVARQENGEPPPDGVVVDDDGDWLVPVQRGWSSKDDAHAEAFMLQHNALPGSVPPDVRIHLAMLEDIQVADARLFDELTVTSEQLDDMLRQAGGPNVELLPDATDLLDGEQTIDVPARPGQEKDTPLDMTKDEPRKEKDEPKRDNICCPACGHLFPARV